MSTKIFQVVAAAGLVLAVAGPAVAQIQTLPETSRSEAQSSAINNSLAAQGANRAISQQNQFEVNSLRNQITTQPTYVAPPVVAQGAVIGR